MVASTRRMCAEKQHFKVSLVKGWTSKLLSCLLHRSYQPTAALGRNRGGVLLVLAERGYHGR